MNKQVLEIEALNISRRTLSESESYLTDRLRLTTNELEELRRVHEASIVELRPVLEGYILQTQTNRSELMNLRREVEVRTTRLVSIEEKTRQANDACEAKERDRQHTLSLLKSERGCSAMLRHELSSQKKILTSAAAANVSHKQTIKELKSRLAKAEETISSNNKDISDLREEICALKEAVSAGGKVTADAQLALHDALREQKATESLYAMQKIELKSVQFDLDEFLKVGFCPEKKKEFDGNKRSLDLARAEIIRLKERNAALDRKVKDLELAKKMAAR